MSLPEPVIVAGARTPIGKFGGAFGSLSAMDLGGRAIAAALERAGLAPDRIDQVVMGHVLQAGQGQITARQAAVKAGIPMTTPSVTVNKVCLSGTNAVATAAGYIQLGLAEIAIGGGMESMSRAPYVSAATRFGARMGDTQMIDSMMYDGLWDAFDDRAMGALTDQANVKLRLTREEQDAWSARSHERAAAGLKGPLREEIVPVEVPQRKGDPLVVEEDEGVRPGTTAESLGRLRPAFGKEGTITAGNASQISDGAGALVITSRAKAEAEGLPILATYLSYGSVAGPDNTLQSQPSRAIVQACQRAGLDPKDLDLFEINEAFAAVAIQSTNELGVDPEKVNVNGGAVALGHPIGASGARLVLTLALELKRRGGGIGAVGVCGGGGQGDAIIIKVDA